MQLMLPLGPGELLGITHTGYRYISFSAYYFPHFVSILSFKKPFELHTQHTLQLLYVRTNQCQYLRLAFDMFCSRLTMSSDK